MICEFLFYVYVLLEVFYELIDLISSISQICEQKLTLEIQTDKLTSSWKRVLNIAKSQYSVIKQKWKKAVEAVRVNDLHKRCKARKSGRSQKL